VTLVCAIEESITRISELVMASRSLPTDERLPDRDLDVHDNLQSTLTILVTNLRLETDWRGKGFEPTRPRFTPRDRRSVRYGPTLIDNARGCFSGELPKIEVRDLNEAGSGEEPGWLAVSITDHGGPGFPPEVKRASLRRSLPPSRRDRGLGLGLEIVHRIVTQKFGGTHRCENPKPGSTPICCELPLKVAESRRVRTPRDVKCTTLTNPLMKAVAAIARERVKILLPRMVDHRVSKAYEWMRR